MSSDNLVLYVACQIEYMLVYVAWHTQYMVVYVAYHTECMIKCVACHILYMLVLWCYMWQLTSNITEGVSYADTPTNRNGLIRGLLSSRVAESW